MALEDQSYQKLFAGKNAPLKRYVESHRVSDLIEDSFKLLRKYEEAGQLEQGVVVLAAMPLANQSQLDQKLRALGLLDKEKKARSKVAFKLPGEE